MNTVTNSYPSYNIKINLKTVFVLPALFKEMSRTHNYYKIQKCDN